MFSADEVDTLSVRLDCRGGWPLSFEYIGLNKKNYVGKVDGGRGD